MSDEYTLKHASGPTPEPVTIQELKDQLRIDHIEEDTYLSRLVKASRQAVEHRIGRFLETQTWELGLPYFPSGRIEIPRPPLLSVISVKYKLEAGTTSTLADSEASPEVTTTVYDVELNDEPGFLFLQPNETWPSDALYPGFPVTVKFTAGQTVEEDIKQAVLMLAAHLYEHREPVIVEPGIGSSVTIPMSVDYLLFPHRDNL